MLKGFKDFIMRGNVIELAIAVVIGTAFQAVVSGFTSAIVTPNVNGLGFSLRHTASQRKNGPGDVLGKSTFINFSTVINALIVFLITAFVVYFLFVLPMNKFQERRSLKTAKGERDPTPKAEDIMLLEQIRDLLADRGSLPTASTAPTASTGQTGRHDAPEA
jgi:large conductance mechanosensitive channel